MGGGCISRGTKRLLEVAVEHLRMLPQISPLLYNAFGRQQSVRSEESPARNNEVCNWMRSCNAYFWEIKILKGEKTAMVKIKMKINEIFK